MKRDIVGVFFRLPPVLFFLYIFENLYFIVIVFILTFNSIMYAFIIFDIQFESEFQLIMLTHALHSMYSYKKRINTIITNAILGIFMIFLKIVLNKKIRFHLSEI